MVIVLTGNPVEGFDIYGPFDDTETAVEWSMDNIESDWWVTDAMSPAAIRRPAWD